MAAMSCIIGSVLGWAAAAMTLFSGAMVSTAALVFVFTSLGFTAMVVCVAVLRAPQNHNA